MDKDENLNDNIDNPCCDYDVESLVREKLDRFEERIGELSKHLLSLDLDFSMEKLAKKLESYRLKIK